MCLQREMIHLNEQQAQGVTFPPRCKVFICSHGHDGDNNKDHLPVVTSSGSIKSVKLQFQKRGSFSTLYNVSIQGTAREPNKEVLVQEKDLRFQNGEHVLFKIKKEEGGIQEEKIATVLGMYDRPLSTLLLGKDDESTFWYVLETEADGRIHNKVDERDVHYWNIDLIETVSNASVPVHIADDCKDKTDSIFLVSPTYNTNTSSQANQQNETANLPPNHIRDQSASFDEKQRTIDFMDQVPEPEQGAITQHPLYDNDDKNITIKVIRDEQPTDDLEERNFKLRTTTEEDKKVAMNRSRCKEEGGRQVQTRRDSQGIKSGNCHRIESSKVPSLNGNNNFEYTYQLKVIMTKGEMDGEFEMFLIFCNWSYF